MSWRELQQIACCPITRDRLRALTDDEIYSVNERVSSKSLFFADGTLVETPLQCGLITKGGKYAYRVDNDIALLLSPKAIVLKNGCLSDPILFDETKQSAADFYDTEGWKKKPTGQFQDAELNEDLREVSRRYIARCHQRVSRCLKPRGEYLLDVASGPIQYPEYLAYSAGYERRVCVDISRRALKDAQAKIGAKGLFVMGDITNLPFHDEVFDGVISLHTIYHVPSDQQYDAFLELFRVLKIGSVAVVVYSWGEHSPLMRPFYLLKRIVKGMGQYFKGLGQDSRFLLSQESQPLKEIPLYFCPHTYQWLKKNLSKAVPFDVVVWRSVHTSLLKTLVPNHSLGRHILELLFALEERFPRGLGRLGAYPMIIIRKSRDLAVGGSNKQPVVTTNSERHK